MIEVGFKFKNHWAGHEYSDNNVYEVIAILKDCQCPNPIYGTEKSPRQKHVHLTCRCIEGPPHLTEGDNRCWFNDYDYHTLRSIRFPDTDYLEIVEKKTSTIKFVLKMLTNEILKRFNFLPKPT